MRTHPEDGSVWFVTAGHIHSWKEVFRLRHRRAALPRPKRPQQQTVWTTRHQSMCLPSYQAVVSIAKMIFSFILFKMFITHLMPQALPPLTDLKFPLEHLAQHADVADPLQTSLEYVNQPLRLS